MMNIIIANRINRVCGVSILPWQVGDLPEDWLDAIKGFDEAVNGKHS